MFEKVFKLSEHQTTVKTEVMAGITTFMTMAYILAVKPAVRSVRRHGTQRVYGVYGVRGLWL